MYLNERADVNAIVQLPPGPIVVNTSGVFDGNDGKWSTFYINIGSDDGGNGQNFKVLISTSSPLTLVPQRTEQCDEECAEDRGILYYNNRQPLGAEDSQYWQYAGTYTIPDTEWWSNNTLAGEWGTDNVGLGLTSKDSPIIAERYVVKYTFDDLFLGSFGLTVGEIGPTGGGKTTFLSEFVNLNQIASNSYGYTAGAYYRNNGRGVLGNLVLGGYDKSRLTEKGTSIPMANRQDNTLGISVISIAYKPDADVEDNTISLTQQAFEATIDSTFPHFVLPKNICDQFEEKFQLEYDNTTQLYTVSSDAHESNVKNNATVAFKIAASGVQDSAEFTTITLPYAAFDLQASYPIYNEARNYFPIKRSTNGVNILGRTFLQEAYIYVDYERANFTVAPARFVQPMPAEELVTIFNTSYVLPTPTPITSSKGLSGGAIAGTVVGIVLVFLLAGLGAFFFWKRKRSAKKEAPRDEQITSEILNTTAAGEQFRHRRVSELTGSEGCYSPKTAVGGYYAVDHKSVPAISELSPESPPSELCSLPPENAKGSDGYDYFGAENNMRRRGAQRDPSGNNTPGTPIAELPGEGIKFPTLAHQLDTITPNRDMKHGRSRSDTSFSRNIDGRLAENRQEALPSSEIEQPGRGAVLSEANVATNAAATGTQLQHDLDRRPSHNRGLSDTTVQSGSTAVSQPTPEELERWNTMGPDDPPMSPA